MNKFEHEITRTRDEKEIRNEAEVKIFYYSLLDH